VEDIQSPTAELRRGKNKIETTRRKYNVLLHRAAIISHFSLATAERSAAFTVTRQECDYRQGQNSAFSASAMQVNNGVFSVFLQPTSTLNCYSPQRDKS